MDLISRANSNNENENNGSYTGKLTGEQSKQEQLEPPLNTNTFSSEILRLVVGRPLNSIELSNLLGNNTFESSKSIKNKTINQEKSAQQHSSLELAPESPTPQIMGQNLKPRQCRPPMSRRFAHPCSCSGPSTNHHKSYSSINSSLPPAAYSNALQLYDTQTKKCLPISRQRDMLLKDCRSHSANTFSTPKPHHGSPCFYDDLVCDGRRFVCTCKPSLHLHYNSPNRTSFGCVPIDTKGSSLDGRINCRPGYFYNVISKECQKIFDVNELPPSYTPGVSATQFSFVTIVLIWILLLILIATAKLRKLRTSNIYINSPTAERRLHHGSNSYRNQGNQSVYNTSAWLHPFINHLNQHRTTIDRHTQALPVDEAGNYNDTDFFLSNDRNRRLNDLLSGENNFSGSQQSLNNPPPKFEEIYPSFPAEQEQENNIQPPPPPPPPSNEDLPSYDEAMKLQNTIPLPPPPPPDPKE